MRDSEHFEVVHRRSHTVVKVRTVQHRRDMYGLQERAKTAVTAAKLALNNNMPLFGDEVYFHAQRTLLGLLASPFRN